MKTYKLKRLTHVWETVEVQATSEAKAMRMGDEGDPGWEESEVEGFDPCEIVEESIEESDENPKIMIEVERGMIIGIAATERVSITVFDKDVLKGDFDGDGVQKLSNDCISTSKEIDDYIKEEIKVNTSKEK